MSPACNHCYAETFSKRLGKDLWGKTSDRRFFGDKHWNGPLRWNRAAEAAGVPARVFCASMADVFEARPDLDEQRARLWRLIGETPWLRWQLLTKRPENVPAMVPEEWLTRATWPWHVWVGTTVEDQQRADERIPHLLAVPAAVRFLSCEPLLGPVDLSAWMPPGRARWRCSGCRRFYAGEHRETCPGCGRVGFWSGSHEGNGRPNGQPLGWVIAGGESGAGYRPLDLDHARVLRDQCAAAGVPFFFKQVGGFTPTAGGHVLDGAVIQQMPDDS